MDSLGQCKETLPVIMGFCRDHQLFPVDPKTGMDEAALKFLYSFPGGAGVQSGAAGTAGESDFELLGDLQLRQGRIQEAVQAYQKAVDGQADPHRKASLYQKMAEATLSATERSR